MDEQGESLGKIEKDPFFIGEEAGVKKINEFTCHVGKCRYRTIIKFSLAKILLKEKN